MSLKQIIKLTSPDPNKTKNYRLRSSTKSDFDRDNGCWRILTKGGYLEFILTLEEQQGVNLIFELSSQVADSSSSSPIKIAVNGTLICSGFDPQVTSFYYMPWPISNKIMRAGENRIIISLIGGTTALMIRTAIVDLRQAPDDGKDWLSYMPDSMSIGDINLPGTHDSAAINSIAPTPYACHRYSITDQLCGGVRLLDVRLKVKKDTVYTFMTCHGDIGSSFAINEYQSFLSLMDECKDFLSRHHLETIILSLKIDDWNGYLQDERNVMNALFYTMKSYPIESSENLQVLGDVRGKIVLLNRINSDPRFGVPLGWEDNTEGSWLPNQVGRNFAVYVQDRYKELPIVGATSYKTDLIKSAIRIKGEHCNAVVLNFASATRFGVIGIYTMGRLLAYFGSSPRASRPQKLGWLLFDYPFEQYTTDKYGMLDIVKFIISSNHNYDGYEQEFVVGKDEL